MGSNLCKVTSLSMEQPRYEPSNLASRFHTLNHFVLSFLKDECTWVSHCTIFGMIEKSKSVLSELFHYNSRLPAWWKDLGVVSVHGGRVVSICIMRQVLMKHSLQLLLFLVQRLAHINFVWNAIFSWPSLEILCSAQVNNPWPQVLKTLGSS